MLGSRLESIRRRLNARWVDVCPECGGPDPAPPGAFLMGRGWSDLSGVCEACRNPASTIIVLEDDIPVRPVV